MLHLRFERRAVGDDNDRIVGNGQETPNRGPEQSGARRNQSQPTHGLVSSGRQTWKARLPGPASKHTDTRGTFHAPQGFMVHVLTDPRAAVGKGAAGQL
jgi:hypothetical protein